jgi:two-component system chemotaxis sensor kinase CheA
VDLSKYTALFLAESRDHLGTCNRLLLEWEREPGSSHRVGGVFRAIHTVKGMAATMGYAPVAELAHRLESLLDALRQGGAVPTPGEFQLLFRSVDALAGGIEAAATGTAAPGDEALAAELEAAAAARAGGAGATPEAPVAGVSGASLAPRASGAFAIPEPGRPVQVVLRRDAVMRGARAALVLQRAEQLGTVSAVRPAPSQFDSQDFDGRFAFRLATAASDADVAAVLTGAGDVESIGFEAEADAGTSGRGRQIRVDLGRLDALMKQVGELVVARNRLGALAAEAEDPTLAEVSDRIARLVSGMQAEVIAARMTPVGEVLERFPRVVRDV